MRSAANFDDRLPLTPHLRRALKTIWHLRERWQVLLTRQALTPSQFCESISAETLLPASIFRTSNIPAIYSGWSQPQTQSNCSSAHRTWTAANHNTCSGCVADRGPPLTTGATAPSPNNYDENVTQPVTGNAATLYPAFQAPSCPQAAMGLNYNWSAMTSLVNNMSPGGSTDQPIGLVWAGRLSLAADHSRRLPWTETTLTRRSSSC